jgi:hypothetical protein
MRTRRLKLTSLALMTGIAASGIVASGAFDRVDAVTINLYDGSSGVTPNNVPNPYLKFSNIRGDSNFPASSQTADGGVTTLNTNGSLANLGGYSNYDLVNLDSFVNPLFPILDRNAGYTLSFTMKLNSQTGNNVNRAGFNALILGNDQKGIEIGFRNSDIFAYNNDNSFSRGDQNSNLNGILSNLNTYDLNVLGNNYTLKNGSNTLLAGSLRDYTDAAANTNNPLIAGIYETPNFLFLGDDRTAAGTSVDIKNISLTTTSVPEPSSMAGVAVAIGCGAMFKRKLRKADKRILGLEK